MNPSAALEASQDEDAELQAGIAQCLTEVEQLREQMARDQIEIDRSRTRTRALLAEIKAAVNSAGRKAA